MAQLRFVGDEPTTVPGVGRVHPNVIHTVPDEMVSELLGGGDWVQVEGVRERVTEPAPVEPVVKPEKSKPRAKRR